MHPHTISELIDALKIHHEGRRDNYGRLAATVADARTGLLLDRLIDIEDVAIATLGEESRRSTSAHSTRLPLGPTLTTDPAHPVECQCGAEPTLEDALGCALSADKALEELIDRLSGASAAQSVQELAVRLRELEENRDRQIANFVRED